MRTRVLNAVQKILAVMMIVALLVTDIPLEVFATNSENSYQSKLDGWTVHAVWNTSSTDYEWDASENTSRQPKITVTYRIRNAEKDYPKGTVTFTVPGIGYAHRGSVVRSDKLSSDQTDSEWNCVWDSQTDLYTFTNNFDVKTGQSLSGGFELLWSLNARECESGYTRTESPTFTVKDAGSISLEPLSYRFTSEKDRYRIFLERNALSGEEHERVDKNYIWYNFQTRFDSDYLSRGLYKSDYFFSVELPDGVDDSAVIAKMGNKTVTLSRNENGVLGFYPFKNKSGNLTTQNASYYETVTLGFKRESLDGKEITINGHLDRLYQDEDEWVREAGENECVDATCTFLVSGYGFRYDGYSYGSGKYNKEYERGYKNNNINDHGEPDAYSDRLPVTGLYNGKVVEFVLHGSAKRSYAENQAARSAKSVRRTMITDEEEQDEILPDMDLLPDIQSVGKSRKKMAASGRIRTDRDTLDETELDSSESDGTFTDDWNDLHWKENGRGAENTELDGITYGEMHPEDQKDITATERDKAEQATPSNGKHPGHQASDATSSDADETDTESESSDSAAGRLLQDLKQLFISFRDVSSMTVFASENTGNSTDTRIETATDSNAPEKQAEKTEHIDDTAEDESGTLSQDYAMVLGDDQMAIMLKNGEIRKLEDDEFDIVYVTVKRTEKSRPYEIYGASTQDQPFAAYTLIAQGDTATTQRITMPDGVKNIFIRVNDIEGSSDNEILIGVRLHLDWDAEREKPEEERPDPEGRLANFSYFRILCKKTDSDDDGESITQEVNVCKATEDNYEETYGKELAGHDDRVYGEYLVRDYSNVWLRSPMTELSATAGMTQPEGTANTGFSTTLSATGRLVCDSNSETKTFSMYVEIPAGMEIDLDEAGAYVSGAGFFANGGGTPDFSEYAMLSEITKDGKRYLVCDFDFSDEPLDAASGITVSLNVPATLSYVDYLSNGNLYTVNSFFMPHDGGLENIRGTAIRADESDLDEDGNTDERMAYASESYTISDNASEWREFLSKTVKSAYSDGYVSDTVVKIHNQGDTGSDLEKSLYSYQLDFGLGSSQAKNVVFFDRIEQGAEVSIHKEKNGETKESIQKIASAWQGTFLSVDTTRAEAIGLIPTIYYSENPEQTLTLVADGWSTEMPADPADVKAVAVSFDTSELEDGVLKPRQTVHMTIHMQAPSGVSALEKQAVNQYHISYDLCNADHEVEEREEQSSGATYVKLLNSVGKFVLQKVDADHLLRTDKDGTRHYASLSGAKIQVYDPEGKALFADGGKETNSLGRVVVEHVPFGVYTWEETEAPKGYQKISGRHPFTIDGTTGILEIENHRVPGSITLTKFDQDDETHAAIHGAEYALYDADGASVLLQNTGMDGEYVYAPDGKTNLCKTGANGTITVTGLPWGTYSFVEETAPQGYQRSEEPVKVTINRDSYNEKSGVNHVDISAYDEEQTASIQLQKTDAQDGRGIKNAVFDLYRIENGKNVLLQSGLRTNAAGEIVVESLKFGIYFFLETKNAGGYEMPEEEKRQTEPVTLNEATAGTVQTVAMSNERKTGSVVLAKTDDTGAKVGGASYALYYREAGETDDTQYGIYETGSDRNADNYGEIHIAGLPWGDYYFVEAKAPVGYDLNTEHVTFSIGRDSVQNTVYLETVDQRSKGSIRLTKRDKNNPSKHLQGATYELFTTDGRKCVPGTDFTLPEGMSAITTGADGTIVVSGIRQGAYYLKELTAPASYTVSDELIRFSVTKGNADTVQELVAEDEAGKAIILVHKRLNAVYGPFGNATVVFTVTRDDGNVQRKSVTFTPDRLMDSVVFTVDAGHTYTVQESKTSRYNLIWVTAQKNATSMGDYGIVDLTSESEAELTFANQMLQYEKFSHMSYALNMVTSNTKLTGIQAVYHGPDPVSDETPGYDVNSESYPIARKYLTVTAFYDDGTERVLRDQEYQLSPEYVDGFSNSYTGTVTYEENGISRTDTFQIKVMPFQETERISVTYDLGGGTIVPDGEVSAQDTYVLRTKQGSVVSRPEHDPEKEGYSFLGWTTAPGISTGTEAKERAFDFSKAQSASVTVYAAWERLAIRVKYAVSIYGIQKDTVQGGGNAGLTFGPATGENYNNTHKKHVTASGYPCIHDMTWEEIIEQSKEDPTVFSECMKNGCTHSVELTISGKLMGEDVSQSAEGDGAGALYDAIASQYRSWNRRQSAYFADTDQAYQTGTELGGWPDSAIRNTLNGTVTANMKNVTNKPSTGDEQGEYNTMFYEDGSIRDALTEDDALISAFPAMLREAIVPKAVRSDTDYSSATSKNSTAYDKLWLFSGSEVYGTGTDSNSTIRPNEGTFYDRQSDGSATTGGTDTGVNTVFAESGQKAWWLRSLSRQQSGYIACIAENGGWTEKTPDDGLALAPGFCLPGPQIDVKYAVSLYGIREDSYQDENGATGTAGLTFGPATGKSYRDSYKSHTPTGMTVSGNAHRCIHADSWKTIAEWSRKDPYVYEQCLDGDGSGESCTKAVPLTLNSKLKRTPGQVKQSLDGDGAGTLSYALASRYLRWNNPGSSYFDPSDIQYKYGTNAGGWPDSMMRNMMTGTITDNMKTKTNASPLDDTDSNSSQMFYPDGTNRTALTEKEALISCFPDALQAAIVPKAVKSDTVSSSTKNNSVTTYDKLWLFSGREWRFGAEGNDIRPNEGTVYSRQSKLGIDAQNYAKGVVYNENGTAAVCWLRSIYRLNKISCYYTYSDGNWKAGPVWNYYSVSPGFCLR